MLHRLTILGALLAAAVFMLCACNGGADQAPIPDPNQDTTVLLPSGGGAVFPGGTFDTATEVDVNDGLSDSQKDPAGFPANSGALLGTTTVKVPAGVVMNADILVMIAVDPMQPTNRVFTIFESNPTTGMWETTAGAASADKGLAAVGSVTDGSIVTFTADSAGTTGFDKTYGVFENLWTSGGGPGPIPPTNMIPTVTLAADNTSVGTGDTVNLTATGSDPDSDPLTFAWMAAGGALGTADTAGYTSTNTWSADAGGAYTVSVSVNDGNGGVATDAVNITVTGEGPPPPPNDAPVFDGELEKNVTNVYTTQEVHLEATVTDPNGDDLTITWGGGGTFSHEEYDAETGHATASWTTDTAGSTTLTVTADDGMNGASATAGLDLTFDVTELPTEFDWMGYTTCADACHSGFSYVTQAGWEGTHHADAWERSLLTSDHLGEHCANCHGVGLEPTGEGGFISYDTTPQFANIQCESCHGTGTGHPGNGALPVPWHPGTGYARDAEGNYEIVDGVYQYDEEYDGSGGYGCGLCHEGLRHGAFEEWMESGHANFALTEEDDDNPGTFVPHHYLTSGSCGPCHSGVQFATIASGQDALDLSGLTLDDPLEDHLIGCATCHDPHSAQYEGQLRIDSAGDVPIPFSDTDDVPTMVMGGTGNICIVCHNGRRDRGDYESRVWEGSGHFGPHGNPQGPMLFGIMGADLYDPPVPTTYESDHAHLSWNENTCTTCHMYRRDYIDSENPRLWGHNFEPRFERCITCHSNFSDEAEFWLWVEEYEAETEALMQAFRDAWPPAWLDGDGEPENREGDPPDGTGPPREDAVGAAYRAALWNYKLVENDASHGIHNPTFTKSLLEDAIASLATLPAP